MAGTMPTWRRRRRPPASAACTALGPYLWTFKLPSVFLSLFLFLFLPLLSPSFSLSFSSFSAGLSAHTPPPYYSKMRQWGYPLPYSGSLATFSHLNSLSPSLREKEEEKLWLLEGVKNETSMGVEGEEVRVPLLTYHGLCGRGDRHTPIHGLPPPPPPPPPLSRFPSPYYVPTSHTPSHFHPYGPRPSPSHFSLPMSEDSHIGTSRERWMGERGEGREDVFEREKREREREKWKEEARRREREEKAEGSWRNNETGGGGERAPLFSRSIQSLFLRLKQRSELLHQQEEEMDTSG